MPALRIAARLCTGLTLCAAVLTACHDPIAPSGAQIASPDQPQREMAMIDHFSCTYDGQMQCQYTGSDINMDFTWFDRGIDHIYNSPTNCSLDLSQCGMGPYSPSVVNYGDESTCFPSTDPNCEVALTDSDKTKLMDAITTQLRDFSTIADPERRARCQEMKDTFLQLLNFDPPFVYRGGSDTPPSDPKPHFGAYVPSNSHMHFDPQYLNGTMSSSTKWQVANTALHEAAHALGARHEGFDQQPHWVNTTKGNTPVYDATDDPYFVDLNPGGQSCMR